MIVILEIASMMELPVCKYEGSLQKALVLTSLCKHDFAVPMEILLGTPALETKGQRWGTYPMSCLELPLLKPLCSLQIQKGIRTCYVALIGR